MISDCLRSVAAFFELAGTGEAGTELDWPFDRQKSIHKMLYRAPGLRVYPFHYARELSWISSGEDEIFLGEILFQGCWWIIPRAEVPYFSKNLLCPDFRRMGVK